MEFLSLANFIFLLLPSIFIPIGFTPF